MTRQRATVVLQNGVNLAMSRTTNNTTNKRAVRVVGNSKWFSLVSNNTTGKTCRHVSLQSLVYQIRKYLAHLDLIVGVT